jgi:hypothetical protein
MEIEGRPAADWFTPHSLHRACATHNYERGMELVAIQQMLLLDGCLDDAVRPARLGNCI